MSRWNMVQHNRRSDVDGAADDGAADDGAANDGAANDGAADDAELLSGPRPCSSALLFHRDQHELGARGTGCSARCRRMSLHRLIEFGETAAPGPVRSS